MGLSLKEPKVERQYRGDKRNKTRPPPYVSNRCDELRPRRSMISTSQDLRAIVGVERGAQALPASITVEKTDVKKRI